MINPIEEEPADFLDHIVAQDMANSIPASSESAIWTTHPALAKKPLPFFEFQDYIRSLNFGAASYCYIST
jgi:hypothetical protein